MRMPLFRRMKPKRWGLILSALVLLSLFLASCDQYTPSILDTHGPVANREAGLFWFTLVVATIVFVIVEGVLIYSIIRFRERPNSPTPKQIHGNNTVEIIWTVAPSLFLFAVLIGTIYTMFGLAQPAGPNVEVRVVGHQWWWEFDYVHENFTTADELVVPQGTTIQLDLESNNVIHSFWIPQLTGKTDVIPGHHNRMWFKADDLTTTPYRGECAEYCGSQHAHMDFNVTVLRQSDYMTWITTQQQAAVAKPTDPTALAGQQLFLGAGNCQGCHGIVGVNLQGFNDPKTQGLIGPNLTHFGSRRLIAGGVLSWDPSTCQVVNGKLVNQNSCGLYQWLHDPQGVKPGNDMVIGQLSDTQIAQLVAYLESLK